MVAVMGELARRFLVVAALLVAACRSSEALSDSELDSVVDVLSNRGVAAPGDLRIVRLRVDGHSRMPKSFPTGYEFVAEAAAAQANLHWDVDVVRSDPDRVVLRWRAAEWGDGSEGELLFLRSDGQLKFTETLSWSGWYSCWGGGFEPWEIE
jgi:hypothetical protein